ncbi:MAG: tRNA uridine-5-carboxymethylaminomethyl(34) synthesis GTPase MnmE [Gammaproteobacteria bacterium]
MRTAPLQDTIAAQATPPGRGGVGIVRVSGPHVRPIAKALLGDVPAPRRAVVRRFLDSSGETIDRGLALYFPQPRSFTGEDVLELQAHGGPIVIDLLVARVLELGARAARPGEFSQRAFLNGKLDLIQAEAIADLIDSASVEAARSAQRTLQGHFSDRVRDLMEGVTELRVLVEAAIDFPDEEVDFLTDASVLARLDELLQRLGVTISSARTGRLLREGLMVVIAGPPNVGKSSLLNRLTERDSAIVTDIPGTTRDLLRESIHIDGLPLQLVDTAGLRATSDVIEQQGVERAGKAIDTADIVLWMVDDRWEDCAQEYLASPQFSTHHETVVVRNKVDLSGQLPGLVDGREPPTVRISATTGAGLDVLKARLKATAGYQQSTEGSFLARRRHLDALHRTEIALRSARNQLCGQFALELVAEDLWGAHRSLGEITGECSSEQLLERIFSSFCIGK